MGKPFKIYSSEWEAMLMTWEKKDLIVMLKDVMQHRDRLQNKLSGGDEYQVVHRGENVRED